MNLERITVEFMAEDDRLLVHVCFSGSAEIMFWMTRRLVKLFWPVLLQMVQSRPEIQSQASPEARKALLGLEHEKALKQVQFSKAAKEPDREHPLGDTPFLVTRIRARRNEKGQTILSMLPKQGKGLDLSLGENLLHGLMKLIQDAANKAEWDLNLEVPTLLPTRVESERTEHRLN
ncbi:MAG: hypothetical protein JSW48_07960 [Betaproteobacteria bacterium]|nr:MAG: hypothetical protein JSW48_07960 [Betaproteobacteria bacterium]